MSELSRQAASLLREARSEFEPAPAELDATREALFAKLGVAAPAAGTSWFAAAGGKLGWTVVAALVAAGSYIALRAPEPAPAASARAASPRVAEPAVVPSERATRAPVANVVVPGAPASSVAEAAVVSSERATPAPSASAAEPAWSPLRARGAEESIASRVRKRDKPAGEALRENAEPERSQVSPASALAPATVQQSAAAAPAQPLVQQPAAAAPVQPLASAARARPLAAEEPVAALPAVARAQPLAAAAPAPPDLLKREVAFVRNARAAADRGETRVALAILDNYERQFGAGILFEEQLALRARVLCAAGELERARTALQRLAARAPSSPHLQRVCPELKTSR